ncbi:TnsD family Tn7-like transposition protein [Undibacterium sp.]|uniref:TnsD family Tn7-like transposition protein n=1 Tax=Undibacterium sp. TaxID=1914977 RepID=UPI0025E6B3BE|nr:TnsD family Tn7-like transposition protein [Undibacterium sp.]
MLPAISFFPPAFPSETLNSRVSRYHIMSGNSTQGKTIAELFQQSSLGLSQIVPPHLDVLALRLPGDASENLKSIIHENTLFPLFLPFIGRAELMQSSSADSWYGGMISRMPRRVVGKHGESYLCPDCLREDDDACGLAYWHREHQAPGVTVCWKHKTALISCCPNCSFPFQRLNKLLTAPWLPCRCGYELKNALSLTSTSEFENFYAKFVIDLIDARYAPISPELLIKTYREKIKSKGFSRGSNVRLNDFIASMIGSLGEGFIASVDPAFSAKKTLSWLRFHVIDGVLDMPITRHVLLGMHLFGTAENMMEAVRKQAELMIDASTLSKKTEREQEKPNQLRSEHRKRILLEKKRDSSLTMQGLWKKALRSTEWLFDNDKVWLEKVIMDSQKRLTKLDTRQTEDDARLDESYANLVEQNARRMLELDGKPLQITIGRLLACLPKKIAQCATRREKYPLLFSRIDQYRESSWCFGARRILWTIVLMKQNELAINPGNICMASKVGHQVILKIIEFTRWDCEGMANPRLHIPTELAKAGIGLTWRGPELAGMSEIGGRGYVSHRPERSSKNVDIFGRDIKKKEEADGRLT